MDPSATKAGRRFIKARRRLIRARLRQVSATRLPILSENKKSLSFSVRDGVSVVTSKADDLRGTRD
jgi:hypothetical protein